VRRREKLRLVDAAAAERAEKQAAKDAAKDAANKRDAGRVTAGVPAYRAEPVVEPVMPVTRPVSAVSAAPLHSAVDEPGLTASERAEAAAARDDARNSAADAPGAPRPPFHG
jgi:hypothetical protein